MLKTREEIKSWLDEQEIIDYTINNDLTVDVDGYVNLSCKDLTEIPVQFNIVDGNFYCHSNQLTSLKGSPKEVNGHFWCDDNDLTSLEGCPKEVKGHFRCYWNKLKSLKYLPETHGKLVCDSELKDTVEYKRWSIYYKIKQMV